MNKAFRATEKARNRALRGDTDMGCQIVLGGGPMKLMTKAEQAAIVPLAKAGDTDARNRLVESVLGLAVGLSKKLTEYPGVHREDYMQEAVLAAIKAVDDYDPKKAGFSTFAYHRMFTRMIDLQRATRTTVKAGGQYLNLLRTWDRVAEKLMVKLGRDPSFDEVADEMGFNAGERERMQQAISTTLTMATIGRCVRGNCNDTDRFDGGKRADESAYDVIHEDDEDSEYDEAFLGRLRSAIDSLKPEHKEYLGRGFGLDVERKRARHNIKGKGTYAEKKAACESEAINALITLLDA